jgi:hypothetical protein
MNGKTGADAVSKAVFHICRLITKFGSKLNAVIAAAETAGAITSAQAALASSLLSSAQAACTVWEAIAVFNSIQP